MTAYPFTNLTSAVRDRDSPLRRYLDGRFGHVKPLQQEYRARSGPLLVDGGNADAATIGAAFDFQVRFLLDPGYVPLVALYGFAGRPERLRVVAAVADAATQSTSRADAPEVGEQRLACACWALALCTEVYRIGRVRPESPLASLLQARRFTPSDLLSLAPSDAVRQLTQLRTLAEQQLLGFLIPPIHLGPTFDGSSLCAADADLIAGGVLLELKTRLGRLSGSTGRRSDALPAADIFQLLSYALFDRSDTYQITAIGVYSARYGTLVNWPLDQALELLAGEPVNLPAAREHVWELLGGRT